MWGAQYARFWVHNFVMGRFDVWCGPTECAELKSGVVVTCLSYVSLKVLYFAFVSSELGGYFLRFAERKAIHLSVT
jgi:hypothetical protein